MRGLLSMKMPKHYDKAIHLCVLILMLFGSIMIASTIVGESTNESSPVIRSIIKQAVFLCVSYFGMTWVARNFVKSLSREVKIKSTHEENVKVKNRNRVIFRFIGIVIVGMMAATLAFPGAKGSRAWIYIGSISIQPSEFAKTYMVVLLGLVVNDFGHRNIKFFQFMGEPLLFFIAIAIFLFFQPDFGTFFIFTLITWFCLLIISNPCMKNLQKIILAGMTVIVLVLLFLSTDVGIAFLEKFDLGYKFFRFTNAADPFKDTYGTGYNLVYSLYAIANGGISGLGLGASKQKFGYLPEAQTDFIFSVTIEELGLFGLALIVICYFVILYKLVYYAMKTKSEGYKIILIGCAVYLMIHFILNVGGVSALLPLTGVPLLFISAGGSSLVSISVLLGVCQSIISLTKGQMVRLESKK